MDFSPPVKLPRRFRLFVPLVHKAKSQDGERSPMVDNVVPDGTNQRKACEGMMSFVVPSCWLLTKESLIIPMPGITVREHNALDDRWGF